MNSLENIVNEIITTERDYLANLNTLNSLFRSKIQQNHQTLILSNLNEIVSLNSSFFNALGNSVESVLTAFEEYSHYFKIYSIYCKNFESSLKLVPSNLPTHNNLNIHSFLLLPIQRIPRYKMFIESILKYSNDSPRIRNLLSLLDSVAVFINETIRQNENIIKVIEIQSLMIGLPYTLVLPSRSLIKTDTLYKVCRKDTQERIFFLFSDVLIYASTYGNGYLFHRSINLNDILNVLAETNPLAFQILSISKSFSVLASTPKERDLWISIIQETKQNQSSNVLKLPTQKQTFIAPIWKPDSSTDSCTSCKTPFTLLYRRHHCRHCGEIKCSQCLNYSFIMPKTQRPVLSCESCFNKIKQDGVLTAIDHRSSIDSNSTFTGRRSSTFSLDNFNPHKNPPNISNYKRLSNRLSMLVLPSSSVLEEKTCTVCGLEFGAFRWKYGCKKCDCIVCKECWKVEYCVSCFDLEIAASAQV